MQMSMEQTGRYGRPKGSVCLHDWNDLVQNGQVNPWVPHTSDGALSPGLVEGILVRGWALIFAADRRECMISPLVKYVPR